MQNNYRKETLKSKQQNVQLPQGRSDASDLAALSASISHLIVDPYAAMILSWNRMTK
jgi:hypothetical protein